MSLDGPGFHVDIEVLEGAAKGIAQSVHDQQSFALRDLCGDSALYGHSGLHSALADYCARWSQGLDTLTEDAEVIGDCLKHVAEAYRSTDAAATEKLRVDPGEAAVED
ncbi:hypothetical protein [Amycolatopsis sp. cmx-11-32]|uniref:hypothetical protein n=1 Tax=Amycolatopsis sp. cmx-11-32 TaxID=2785796 RepID=UPI0039E52D07